MTLCFDQDPTYNVLFPPLRMRLTQFASTCNLADVGKKITNVMISNNTSDSSASSMKPDILSMRSSNVVSSGATLTINTRTSGIIYYLCIDSGFPTISSTDSIIALNNTNGIVGTVNSSAQTVMVSNVAQVNYIAVTNLAKLNSSTNYIFYAV